MYSGFSGLYKGKVKRKALSESADCKPLILSGWKISKSGWKISKSGWKIKEDYQRLLKPLYLCVCVTKI